MIRSPYDLDISPKTATIWHRRKEGKKEKEKVEEIATVVLGALPDLNVKSPGPL